MTNITTIDWNEMKEKIAGLIRLYVFDDVMNHILDLKTLKNVWNKFENRPEMQEGGNLQAHVNAFNNILADLAQLDVKVDNENKVVILLCSLLDSYDHWETTLTYGKETIMLNSISSTSL
ncbi:unnamed protein product [Vicia faba]|uniref:Retrovirus-related Pol polyprotein from transposon TNT 1-94 n=1 Tax=Vicia faba TaxID=3906 RepID=A0AAV0YST9_VICFA|nr:unnamed protein product [Vicia faba]